MARPGHEHMAVDSKSSFMSIYASVYIKRCRSEGRADVSEGAILGLLFHQNIGHPKTTSWFKVSSERPQKRGTGGHKTEYLLLFMAKSKHIGGC